MLFQTLYHMSKAVVRSTHDRKIGLELILPNFILQLPHFRHKSNSSDCLHLHRSGSKTLMAQPKLVVFDLGKHLYQLSFKIHQTDKIFTLNFKH